MLIVSPSKRTSLLIFMVFNFLLLPLVMLVTTTLFLGILIGAGFAELNNAMKTDRLRGKWYALLILVPLILIEIAIGLVVSASLAIFLTAIVIIPAYFF